MGYIDPGALGMVAQIGSIVLFTVVSAFLFLSRPLKNACSRLLRRRAPAEAEPEPAPPESDSH